MTTSIAAKPLLLMAPERWIPTDTFESQLNIRYFGKIIAGIEDPVLGISIQALQQTEHRQGVLPAFRGPEGEFLDAVFERDVQTYIRRIQTSVEPQRKINFGGAANNLNVDDPKALREEAAARAIHAGMFRAVGILTVAATSPNVFYGGCRKLALLAKGDRLNVHDHRKLLSRHDNRCMRLGLLAAQRRLELDERPVLSGLLSLIPVVDNKKGTAKDLDVHLPEEDLDEDVDLRETFINRFNLNDRSTDTVAALSALENSFDTRLSAENPSISMNFATRVAVAKDGIRAYFQHLNNMGVEIPSVLKTMDSQEDTIQRVYKVANLFTAVINRSSTPFNGNGRFLRLDPVVPDSSLTQLPEAFRRIHHTLDIQRIIPTEDEADELYLLERAVEKFLVLAFSRF